MKQLFFLLFIIWTSAKAQSVRNGIYTSENKNDYFYTEVVNFGQNNSFKFLTFGPEGNSFGSGKYLIKNDSIYLMFEKCKKYGKERNLTTINRKSDSLKIQIKTMFENEQISSYCQLLESGKSINPEAELNITIPKNNKNLTLRFSFIGTDPTDILIDTETAEIHGEVLLDNYHIKENEIEQFKLLKRNDKKIVLSSLKQKKSFKKIDKHSALKKLQKLNANANYEFYIKAFTAENSESVSIASDKR